MKKLISSLVIAFLACTVSAQQAKQVKAGLYKPVLAYSQERCSQVFEVTSTFEKVSKGCKVQIKMHNGLKAQIELSDKQPKVITVYLEKADPNSNLKGEDLLFFISQGDMVKPFKEGEEYLYSALVQSGYLLGCANKPKACEVLR